MTSKRRKVSIQERLTPCVCCGHPLSQRHHLFDVSAWGENPKTIQLCANCHELYHLIYFGYIKGSTHCKKIVDACIRSIGYDDARFKFLFGAVEWSDKNQREFREEIFYLAIEVAEMHFKQRQDAL